MLPLELLSTCISATARSLIARGPERVDQQPRNSLEAVPLADSMLITQSDAITLRQRSASANCAVLAKIPAALQREQIDTVAPLLLSAAAQSAYERQARQLCALVLQHAAGVRDANRKPRL